MSKIRIVAERRSAGSGTYSVNRKFCRCRRANINVEGMRASDNAQFTVASWYDVEIGDTIEAVVDDVTVDHLVGAYNFYYSLRDESGYNLDGRRVDASTGAVYGVETNPAMRHEGHKYLDCDAQRQVIKVTPSSRENNQVVDFEESREIQLWVKPNTLSDTNPKIIFDRMDNHSGIQIGIQKSGSNHYVYVKTRTWDGSATEERWTGDSGNSYDSKLQVTTGTDTFIRVWEAPDGGGSATKKRNYISVNGGSAYLLGNHTSLSEKLEDTVSDFYIGGSAGLQSDYKFDGRIYSVRLYNRKLLDNEGMAVYQRLPAVNTMKFGGEVIDVKSGGGVKVIKAVGWSRNLFSVEITENTYNGLTNNPTGNFQDKLMEEIIETTVDGINANLLDQSGVALTSGHLGKDIQYEFQFKQPNDEDDDRTDDHKKIENQWHMRRMDRYDVGGGLITSFKILATLGGKEYDSNNILNQHLHGADQFFVSPRKTIIFESSEIPNNSYYSTLHGYRPVDNGFDDTDMVNDVIIFGTPSVKHKNFNVPNVNSSSNSFNVREQFDTASGEMFKKIHNISVLDTGSNYLVAQEGASNDYTFDGTTITWRSSDTKTFRVNVEYYDLANKGATLGSDEFDGTGLFYNQQNQDSIKKYGIKSKKLQITGFGDVTSAAAFCRRLLGLKGEPKRTVTIVAPRLMNGIGIGNKTMVNSDHQHLENEVLIVKSISYSFPSMRTTVLLGDYSYDFVDSFKEVKRSITEFHDQMTSTN